MELVAEERVMVLSIVKRSIKAKRWRSFMLQLNLNISNYNESPTDGGGAGNESVEKNHSFSFESISNIDKISIEL